ncbi:MAG: response regulator transcription factor [Ethanoligenens sp.]
MKKILVVEDDVEINQLITKYLQKEGYTPYSVFNGNDAVSFINNEDCHLIILDLMLPRMDGQEVLREIRKNYTMPVIILSAKDRETDKILGLELGADDYITKPFTIGELTARVKAQLRRSTKWNPDPAFTETKIIRHGDLELNTGTYEVKVAGETKTLTSKEFAILLLFLENPTRVFTKAQIFESVWHEESLSDNNTVMVHINRLRSKIEADPSNSIYIQTVWGFGYKLGGQ